MPYREVYIVDGDNSRWETIYEPDPPAAKPKPAAAVKPTTTTTAAKTTTAPASSFVLGQSNLPGIETRYLDLGESTVPQYFVAGTNIQVDAPTYFEDYFQGPLTESSVPTLVQGNTGIYDEKKGGSYVYSPDGKYIGFVEGKRDGSLFGFLKDVVKETAPIWSAALTGGAAGSSLGASILPSASAATQTALGNAILQGASSEAQGGDFLKGALSSAVGSTVGNVVTPELSAATGSNALANALTSGSVAKLQGGDFLQGAIQGGISGLTQDAKLALADQYINSANSGVGYDPATLPTELDVIDAYPELAPLPENLTQGVTDILNYAANAPSIQLAAGPNYVGDLSGVQYDPNYVSDSGTGAYRLEIGGTGDQQGAAPSPITVPTQEQAQLNIEDLINQLEPYLSQNPTLDDIQSIISQQNFATPQDIQTAINSINIPRGLSESDVQNIVSNAFATNPTLNASDVQSIVNSAVSQIPAGLTAQDVTSILGQQNFATPQDIQTAISSISIPKGISQADVQNIVSNALTNNPGLTAKDVQSIVDSAVSRIPAGLTAQDVTSIIGKQNFATPEDIRTAINGINIPKGLSEQDVQGIVSNAFANNPSLTSEQVSQIVNGAISQIPAGLTSSDVQSIVGSAISKLPAAPTQQDIINIIGQQNFATPQDIQKAIAGIQFPAGMTPTDVQNIVSEAFQNNPGITATEVQGIVQGALNNLPPGLSSDDVKNIVTDAVANIPKAPTEQDIINIIGGQGLASTAQLSQQGKSLMDALQAQGIDYQTALNQALSAQASNFQGQLTDVQAGLGSQISNLSQQTQQQLAQQSTQTQQQFQNLSDAQKAQANALVNQGTSLTNAINQVQTGLGQQIASLSQQTQEQLAQQNATTQQQFSGLSAAQQAQADALVKQGSTLTNAINQVQAGLGQQITSLSQQTQSQLAQQSLQTQEQFNSLTAAQKAQADALVNQGASLNSALSQVQSGLQSQIGGVQAGLESQLSAQGKQFMNALQAQGIDYQTALNQAVTAQSNQFSTSIQDVVNQIGNVQTGLETQLNQQGKDFMDYLQQQGFDYETSLNEALQAQKDEFGTALNKTTEDLLKELASSGSGLQTQFETGLQGLADQLGITQQELINQLNQTQESFGSEIGNLKNQFTSFDEANAQRYADLIKTVGLVGSGLGALQSTFNTFRDQNTPKQFEIVAPPSDWKSPTYGLPATNTAPFAPSAPLDFGSRQLLQGTQFARPAPAPYQMPYDLSNVVNTLNYESVPFVQQPIQQPTFAGFANQPTSNVGVNDIIGGLNGKPVSIADIISNIQGQYGQKAAS